MSRLGTMALVSASLVLGACSLGNVRATHIRSPLTAGEAGKPSGVFVDASQRAILTGYPDGTGKPPIICAEPSPDVFSAIAARAGISVQQLAEGLAAEGGLNEAAASIGLRTQTITILRDIAFQPCLSRLNGGDPIQYDMLLRRTQTNIAGLLAIEQLTGAVRGPSAAVGATAGTGTDMKAFHTALAGGAKAEIDKATQRKTELTGEKTKLEADGKTCDAPATAKPEVCSDDAKAARTKRLAEIPEALLGLDNQIASHKAQQDTHTALAASAPAAQPASALALSATPPVIPTITAEVVKAVENIATKMIERDYSLQMCFDYARTNRLSNADAAASVRLAHAYCEQVLRTSGAQREAALNVQNALATQIVSAITTILEDNEISTDEVDLLKTLLSLGRDDGGPSGQNNSSINFSAFGLDIPLLGNRNPNLNFPWLDMLRQSESADRLSPS